MSKHENIVKLMMQYVYRDVIAEKEMQTMVADSFIQAKTQTAVINLLGFALGYVQREVMDLREYERDNLFDGKVRKQLLAIVERMPSLEFLFIPLVLIRKEEGIQQMPLLRVRKPPAQTVYLDMALRMYDTFEDFLTRNKLPPCELWYPTDGLIRFDAQGQLRVSRRTIEKRNDNVWKTIAIVGNVAATGLMLTPFAPVTAPILLLVSNVPLIGFSIADLVDGCRYERGSVIAGRSAALVVNLVTFSAVGLTAAFRSSALRGLLSANKLVLLEQAESIMNVTARTVSSAHAVYSIIGTVGGWQELSALEWVQVATNLCFAFHEVISVETATRLFRLLQVRGVVQFFNNCCPNVARVLLEAKVDAWLGKMLDLVFRFLSDNVEFTVDKEFTTIRLFGYELQFETLFQLNTDSMLLLLNYLKRIVAPMRQLYSAKENPFTMKSILLVVDFLKLIEQFRNVPCKLHQYIMFGKGHRFSLATLQCWFTLEHNRPELLKALVSLPERETEQLNHIRETKLGPDADATLFRWLVRTGGNIDVMYERALNCLLTVAGKIPTEKIIFDGDHIVVSPLLSISPAEFMVINDVDTFLSDTRFMRLCKETEEEKVLLMPRAKHVWMRTCSQNSHHRELETVSLLKKLFVHARSISLPFTLAEGLDYALDIDGATVSTVYYSILIAWPTMGVETLDRFDRATMRAVFVQLMHDAEALQMNRSMMLTDKGATAPVDDEDTRLIDIARQAVRYIHYGENCPRGEELYFGTKERAAFWLHQLPSLRKKPGRDQFNSCLRWLVKQGDAKVLSDCDTTDDGAVDAEERNIRRVMFSHGKLMVVLEMIPLVYRGSWQASLQLCSMALKRKSTLHEPQNGGGANN